MNNRETINKMVSIAQLYYLHNLPRSEIAKRLGISRQLVSKLLERSQKEGLIEIKIVDPFDQNKQLGKKLCGLTGLREVIVVPSPNNRTELVKRNIGLAAGEYLVNNIVPGTIIGLGWGKTLSEMINNFPRQSIPDTYVVPLIGGIGRIDPDLQVNNLAMLLSLKIGSTPLLLYSPAIIETEILYSSLLETVSSVIEFWGKIDVALIGIGTSSPDSLSEKSQEGYKSYTERLNMRDQGAVGDICMHYFDINGNEIESKIFYKMSMNLEQIKKIPLVIGMAGGLYKLEAIQGAIAGKIIDVLITDEYVAQELIVSFSKKNS